ncbi:meiotic recombination protein REC114 isoform X2 [Osmerus eperlanus]|uniref:meiotic recombination protein REC114 isoform X2 n=1 Tax=Osmerus eperlanus TaxID=29151 RepID=UPI002E15E09A
MATAQKSIWKLKRFGRFLPGSKDICKNPWKMFESNEGADELILTIVESGHMLVSQGQELLGESRLMRMQFGGSCRAESLEECRSAVLRLKEYLPVSSQGGAPPPLSYSPAPNQTPTETTTLHQQTLAGETMGLGPEVTQGSLSVKHLTQHFLGERGLSLPLLYNHCVLQHGEMEPFLRLCLLDPSFPAFVEEVEGELRRLLQD